MMGFALACAHRHPEGSGCYDVEGCDYRPRRDGTMMGLHGGHRSRLVARLGSQPGRAATCFMSTARLHPSAPASPPRTRIRRLRFHRRTRSSRPGPRSSPVRSHPHGVNTLRRPTSLARLNGVLDRHRRKVVRRSMRSLCGLARRSSVVRMQLCVWRPPKPEPVGSFDPKRSVR